MASVQAITKAKMLEIIAALGVDWNVDPGTGHLLVTLNDGSIIDAGNVIGPTGPQPTLSTDAETITGTLNTKAISPANLAAWRDVFEAQVTVSLSGSANGTFDIPMPKVASIVYVDGSDLGQDSRWCLYMDAASRTSDATRVITADPVSGVNLVAEGTCLSAEGRAYKIPDAIQAYNIDNDGTWALRIFNLSATAISSKLFKIGFVR